MANKVKQINVLKSIYEIQLQIKQQNNYSIKGKYYQMIKIIIREIFLKTMYEKKLFKH